MMPLNLSIRFACTWAVLLICCFAAGAQTRTFVSGLGSDANPCTRASPCRSFQRAHDVVDVGGEVIAVDSAGYGPVTITKSVTILGDGVYAGINTSSGDGVTIATAGITVNLRSLIVEGLGSASTGINVTSVGSLHLERCVISGFAGVGIHILLAADGSEFFIKDTITRNNGFGLISGTSTGIVRGSIDNSRAQNNVNIGFDAARNSRVTIKRSVASGNGGSGFAALSISGATTELSCEECVSSNNFNGFFVNAGATIRVSRSTATNNSNHGFANDFGGTFYSRGNNTVAGNNGAQTSGPITPLTAL